jgi:hypothetical protein
MKFIWALALSLAPGLVLANLIPVGEGTARWGFFKLYDAQFFASPQHTLAQALADDTPAQLKLCYARSLTVDNFVDGANHVLPADLPTELQQAVERLHRAYLPVNQGDCYLLDYQPGIGTRLILNENTLVQIETPGFKALYFGIWLGEQPLSDKLKQALTQNLKGTP